MNFQDETDRERRRKTENETGSPPDLPRTLRKKKQPAEYGDALRSVYQRTISEDIPPEMLDLLGKLD